MIGEYRTPDVAGITAHGDHVTNRTGTHRSGIQMVGPAVFQAGAVRFSAYQRG